MPVKSIPPFATAGEGQQGRRAQIAGLVTGRRTKYLVDPSLPGDAESTQGLNIQKSFVTAERCPP